VPAIQQGDQLTGSDSTDAFFALGCNQMWNLPCTGRVVGDAESMEAYHSLFPVTHELPFKRVLIKQHSY
jgi:hypothetical protein